MGMPVNGFIAATNSNDVVPAYLLDGNYTPRASISTISNAMDVGAPSNFVRMSSLFSNSWDEMKSLISGAKFSDEQTRKAIREVYNSYEYQIDPHGAVGWLAATAHRRKNTDAQTITLETAHPAKFLDVMEKELGKISWRFPSA